MTKMHSGGKYEKVGKGASPDHPKVKFHGSINGLVFMGSGSFSEATIEHLHKRLDEGFSHLSGAQQNGGMGTEYDLDMEKECDKQIDSVVREIALALTGKNIQFEENENEI